MRQQSHTKVSLANILDAVNSLPSDQRPTVVAALKLHDPATHYFTVWDGRVEAESVG